VFRRLLLPDAELSAPASRQRAAAHRIPPCGCEVCSDGYSLIDSQMKTNFGVLFAPQDYEERNSPDLSANAVIEAGRRER